MKPFEITDSAKAQIERLLEKNTGKYAVSLAVLGGGCAGFKYDWGFVDTKENVAEGDHVEDWGTGRFVVDETSLLYVMGTKIDWIEETFGYDGLENNYHTPQYERLHAMRKYKEVQGRERIVFLSKDYLEQEYNFISCVHRCMYYLPGCCRQVHS